MARNDFRVYPENGRWHFTIINVFEGSAGVSSPIYESQADHPQGYESEEEAKKKAIEYINLHS